MWRLIWPILIVILSNTFYNICMKSMPGDVNPFGALMVTYLVAAIISAIIFVYVVGPTNVGVEISKINWTSVVLALAIVGLEVGYVFVYRAGWTVSTASVVANIGLACVLIFVGYFLYKENVSLNQIVGVVVCMFGLVLINL
ncbi:EamA family transporter [Methanobrevibacter sp.]|uniref:EamA family transporter n=1 Tax=Methanobrevibacter sp. TaxID=66852 RepID=UPI0025E97E70|nr:EamA family transporter [Methanobrevibacter sp.]MBQ2831465.1 EamA family transporter [Methanobrevibacter sp.]